MKILNENEIKNVKSVRIDFTGESLSQFNFVSKTRNIGFGTVLLRVLLNEEAKRLGYKNKR